MNLYSEFSDAQGRVRKEWNYCHPSGYAGLVVENFYPSGKLHSRRFSVNGNLHRPVSDGPAYESFYESGKLLDRQFCVDDNMHRPVSDGPACESFYESGKLRYRHFYVDGEQVDPP